MTRTLLRVGSCVGLLWMGAALAAPSSPPSTTPRIRTEQVGGSLREYLEAASEEAGARHVAERPHDRRAITALEINAEAPGWRAALARAFTLTWREPRDRDAPYTLYESHSNRAAKAAWREAARLRGRQRLQRRWEEVRAMAQLSPDQLANLARRGDRMAQSLLHPRGAAAARLCFSLPAAQIQRVWSGEELSLSTSSLPPALQAASKDAIGPSPKILFNGVPVKPTETGTFRLALGGTPDRPTVWSSLNFGAHGVVTNLLYAEAGSRQPPQERRAEARAFPTKTPNDPRFQQRVTLTDPALKSAHAAGERPPGAKPLAVLLKELARQTHLPVLAECDYRPRDSAWMTEQWWLAEEIRNTPLHQALDLLCADFEYEWRFEAGHLVLRSRYWYLDPGVKAAKFPF